MKRRKPLSVCGELASNPAYARKLLAAGIRAVSVAPRAITGLRIAIKNKPKLAKKRITKLFNGKKKRERI